MPGDPTATTPPPQHLRVGRIGRAYQLEGGVRLHLEPGVAPEAVRAGARLFVTGYGPAAVRAVRPHAGGPVLYLEGVRDRDAARALTGAEVHVPEGALPEGAAPSAPSAGAAGAAALIGREVRHGEDRIGVVTGVRPAAGNPLLVVDAGGRELLLPLAAPYVQAGGPEVRLVDPPEGLLEP